ncbi:MAG: hypothetical protein GQ477_04965, partial [Nanohaloarchaea archaeon]|nr:hypothetical protein [Candidatus Nanohaloarchaea archaeon]
ANYTSGGDNFNIKKSQNHFLQWKIIEYLKENNFEFYELGWQQYPSQLNMLPTDKEVNISRYKRSFGGFDVSVYGGEKFYSKSLFLLTSLNRTLKYFLKLTNNVI